MAETLVEIRRRRFNIDAREREARMDLLRDHNRRYAVERAELADACVALGGHEWYDLPNNGLNRRHIITGEWPQACRWCGTHKPPATPTRAEDRRDA